MNPNIYLMDIRNFTWVGSFTPDDAPEDLTTPTTSDVATSATPNDVTPNDVTTPATPNDSKTKSVSNKQIIIIAPIIGVAFIIFICGFLIYRWNKNKRATYRQLDSFSEMRPRLQLGVNRRGLAQSSIKRQIF